MANFKDRILPYLPGIIILVLAILIGCFTYQDYGMGWDEPGQRAPAVLSYDYMFHGSKELFIKENDNHGAGFELLLYFIERGLHLTDARDIYMNRHIVTHLFYLFSMFAGYLLLLKLFNNKFIAALGFFILVFTPRLYAHSFFNSKDIPFMCMVMVTLAYSYVAFQKNKTWHYLLLGLLCGYATSIRVMGILLAISLLLFLLIDLVAAIRRKEKPVKPILSIVLFSVGFCFILYMAWPYLWKGPVQTFIDSFKALAHFKWGATTLIAGKPEVATSLPWTYFPTWFLITNPILWLVAGFAGIGWVIYDIFRKPAIYLQNTKERNFLLYVLNFFIPIFSVILMHSVMYDDWRHMFFVYPPFVLMAMYFLYRIVQNKYRMIVQGICALQVLAVGYFMVQNHPFNQVYFNELVSHDEEYLRKNYELDYWGCSFKQALDHIMELDPRKHIKICCNLYAYLENNILMLHPEDRKRIEFVPPEQADYFITNFRGHPEDYPGTTSEFTITVLNSSILQIFPLKKIDLRAQ
jgi:dolichyl-phosphate-mannose-protein mannosyltransferase